MLNSWQKTKMTKKSNKMLALACKIEGDWVLIECLKKKKQQQSINEWQQIQKHSTLPDVWRSTLIAEAGHKPQITWLDAAHSWLIHSIYLSHMYTNVQSFPCCK